MKQLPNLPKVVLVINEMNLNQDSEEISSQAFMFKDPILK